MTDPAPPHPTAAPRKRGCLFYGCLTLMILAVVGAVGAYLVYRYVSHQIAAVVLQYTEDKPLALPKATMSDADFTALQQRVQAFGQALEAGKPVESLVLNAAEINALLARSPALTPWRDRLYVSLEGGDVRGQLSLPLDSLGSIPMLSACRGRYLNGAASFRAGMTNQHLFVGLDSVSVKGVPLPSQFLAAMAQQNLAEPAYQDPQKAHLLSRLANVTVEGGQLRLTPK